MTGRPKLFDFRMSDGSRHFGELPETYDVNTPQWHTLRDWIARLPGASLTGFLSDEVVEAWIDFSFRGHAFALNNQMGDWWFFVEDPQCPDAVLQEVLEHCRGLLGSRGPG